MIKPQHLIALAVIAVMVSAACLSDEHEETTVRVVYAGSLIIPFEELAQQFESEHPDIDVQMEGHGSIQAIRQITDIDEEFDVVAVADDSLIPDMMYPEYADWYVRFAGNQMVIAFTNKSLYADEINESNWYRILARPEVNFGFSNPMFDAAGYRTLMVVSLAERYYDNRTIFDDLIACNFDPPLSLREQNGGYRVRVPEILEPKSDKIAVRGGSVQLLALLDYAGIDYAFEYKSVAQQHGLRYQELPPEIDLRSPEYSDLYEKITIMLGFQRFSSIGIERVGKPIFYGITVPENAPHPGLGVEFVNFVLSDEGQRIMGRAHQPTVPPEADNLDNVPETLKLLVVKRID